MVDTSTYHYLLLPEGEMDLCDLFRGVSTKWSFSVSKIFCYTRITRASLKSQQHHSSDLASSTPSSSVRLRYHRSTSTTSKQDYPSPEPDMFEVVLYTFTVFENHPKCRIWICQLWHFTPIFDLLKLTCLVTLFDRFQGFQKLAKLSIFNKLLSTQNVNADLSVNASKSENKIDSWICVDVRNKLSSMMREHRSYGRALLVLVGA